MVKDKVILNDYEKKEVSIYYGANESGKALTIKCGGAYNEQNSLNFLPQAKVIFRQNLVWTTKRSIDKFGLSIVDKYRSSSVKF